MSRSGYTDDDYDNTAALWRGAVQSAINGKRGQQFLRELLVALDAMPAGRLIANSFRETSGEVCALGSVGARRGIDMSGFTYDEYCGVDREQLSAAFGIAPAMAAEIMFINDDDFGWDGKETPEQRFKRVRAWVVEQIRGTP